MIIIQKCPCDENLVIANYENKIANIDFTDIVSAIAELNNIKKELWNIFPKLPYKPYK